MNCSKLVSGIFFGATLIILTGCASQPSFGEKLETEGGAVKILGERWNEGEKMVKKGIAMKEDGEKMQKKGQRSVSKGEELISKGRQLKNATELEYGRDSQVEATPLTTY